MQFFCTTEQKLTQFQLTVCHMAPVRQLSFLFCLAQKSGRFLMSPSTVYQREQKLAKGGVKCIHDK